MKLLYLANIRLPTEKAHGTQIVHMCEAFAEAGHQVTLVVTNRRSHIPDDPFAYYGVEPIFKIVRLPTLDTVGWGKAGFILESAVFAVFALWYALSHSADIIFSRDEVVLWPILFFKKNVVWESHDVAWNAAARRVARRVRLVVTTTNGAKDLYAEGGIPVEKMVAIPNGIDAKDFAGAQSKDAARARLSLPLDAKIAMYIGRLDGWKGTRTLFEASKQLDDILFVVIGGEPDQIAALAKEYPHVKFLGPRPYRELPDNQAAADVLIVPNSGKSRISTRYTSPLKLVAHMASGRPIVASDLPSIREVAEESVAYCTPDDPDALAQAIRGIFADTAHANELVRMAKERVRMLSWENRARVILSRLGAPATSN